MSIHFYNIFNISRFFSIFHIFYTFLSGNYYFLHTNLVFYNLFFYFHIFIPFPFNSQLLPDACLLLPLLSLLCQFLGLLQYSRLLLPFPLEDLLFLLNSGPQVLHLRKIYIGGLRQALVLFLCVII